MSRPRTRSANRSQAAHRQVTQQLRALAHPLRLRLVEAFAQGPRTTMQVANRLGEPPTRLYHHVNALERAGILTLVDTRQVRGTTEKYYRVARKRLGVTQGERLTSSTRASIASIANAVFDEARQELLTAVARPGPLATATAPTALRMILSIPPSQVPRVRRRILEMLKKIKQESARTKGKSRTDALQWGLTVAFSPTVSRTEAAPEPRRRSKQ